MITTGLRPEPTADEGNSAGVPSASPVDTDDRFAALLEDAERRLSRGDHLGASVRVRMAANAATTHHPGLFQSARAEAVLKAVSLWLCRGAQPNTVRGQRNGERPSILHVMTEAYPIGGHTRALQRWIEADEANVHHLAITHQLATVPEPLTRSVAASGGRLSILSATSSLFGIARGLRTLAAGSQTVVLHIHPHDVTPMLAFAGWPERPPIALFNHADHVFWLGESIADTVINFRESGSRLCRARRGIGPERDVLLPLPLLLPAEPIAFAPTKSEARQRLGLPTSARITLTVASAGKLRPNAHANYFELHRPLFEADPDLLMLLVGPDAGDAVLAGRLESFDGRMRALGVQMDLAPLMAAADVYVDSTPFASQTSMLEAALQRLPAVGWRPYPDTSLSLVMGTDDVAFRDQGALFTDPDAYRAAVLDLLKTEARATELGARLAAAIQRHHAGPLWREALANAYRRTIANAAARPHAHVPAEARSEVDDIVLAFQQGAGFSHDPLDLDNFEFMPLRMQLAEVSAISRRHPDVLKRFLPAGARQFLGKIRWPR